MITKQTKKTDNTTIHNTPNEQAQYNPCIRNVNVNTDILTILSPGHLNADREINLFLFQTFCNIFQSEGAEYKKALFPLTVPVKGLNTLSYYNSHFFLKFATTKRTIQNSSAICKCNGRVSADQESPCI